VVAPMRERRAALAGDRSFLRDVLRDGTERADEVTRGVLRAVRQAFALSA